MATLVPVSACHLPLFLPPAWNLLHQARSWLFRTPWTQDLSLEELPQQTEPRAVPGLGPLSCGPKGHLPPSGVCGCLSTLPPPLGASSIFQSVPSLSRTQYPVILFPHFASQAPPRPRRENGLPWLFLSHSWFVAPQWAAGRNTEASSQSQDTSSSCPRVGTFPFRIASTRPRKDTGMAVVPPKPDSGGGQPSPD